MVPLFCLFLGLENTESGFRSLSVSAEALLHEEMEALKRRRGELKRQCRQAARDSKVLAKKRQRLLQAGCGQVDSAAALCLCPC